jgi:hypothetical protein
MAVLRTWGPCIRSVLHGINSGELDWPIQRNAHSVKTRTLDSFELLDVGFLKINVEGQELSVLRGADETIAATRPVVFIESEARHAHGAPANVIELMRDRYGYRKAAFVRRWKIVDLEEFDLQRDQLRLLPDYANPDYVSNFVFWPS